MRQSVLLYAVVAAAPYAPPSGHVAEFQIRSKVYGRDRRVWVYTPPAYRASGADSYGLVVAFDGYDYRDSIPLPAILDSLAAAHKAPPLVAVLIDNSSGAARLGDLANQPAFAAFLSDDVIPWVRQRYNVTHDPHRTIVTGSSAGGLAAAYVALVHPELFGNVLSQSGAFWRGYAASNSAPYEWLTKQYAAQPRRDVRFFVDVGSLETIKAVGVGPVFIAAVRRFRDVLKTKGYPITYTEVPGGQHSPETWIKRLPIGLAALAGDFERE
jgi:enterochelin esterase family protein